MYNFHKYTLEQLHKSGFWMPPTAPGGVLDYSRFDDFFNLIPASRELEALELARLSTGQAALHAEFSWVDDAERSMVDATYMLEEVYLVAQSLDSADTRRAMLDQAYQQVIPDQTRLIVELLIREELFELEMARHHVFDAHRRKRLLMYHWEAAALMSPATLDSGMTSGLTAFQPVLEDLQRLLRYRFDYKRLVDWGYGRFFMKLYIVIATTGPYRVSAEAVEEFRAWLRAGTKLAKDMFLFEPGTREGIRADEMCVFCMDDYKVHDQVIQLPCTHFFHASCLIPYFDQTDHYDNVCPTCRTSAPRLIDRLTFVPEEVDLCYKTSLPGVRTRDSLLDHVSRHYLRRGLPVASWDDDTKKRHWDRERKAWYDGAKFADRASRFPRMRLNVDEVGSATTTTDEYRCRLDEVIG